MRTCLCPTLSSVSAIGSHEPQHNEGVEKGRTQDEVAYMGGLDGFLAIAQLV